MLLFGQKEKDFVIKIFPKSVCPMRLKRIELVDFFRNGRNYPKSIVFGHYEFRGVEPKVFIWKKTLFGCIELVIIYRESIQ